MANKILFSGIQPSGVIHLGNYIGALGQWVNLQEKYKSMFCVVDLHAVTAYQNPDELRKNTIQTAKILLSAGIDPKKSVVFAQSYVPQHLELYWILNTITKVSELFLMTQFKDKGKEQESKKGVFAGLLNYPVLMASDILLYGTGIVPVGEDQIQHVELAREIARRFNTIYGKTFVEPEPVLVKSGARIMGLDNPEKKMSKSSQSPDNYISLLDSPKIIKEKIKRAVTDSGSEIKYDIKNKSGISNLLSIMSAVSGKDINAIEKKYSGKKYSEFKEDVASAVVEFLEPIQSNYKNISDVEVARVLSEGAEIARKIAEKKIESVYKKVGLR
jgi:tryptophanyl-tRNA synthetase